MGISSRGFTMVAEVVQDKEDGEWLLGLHYGDGDWGRCRKVMATVHGVGRRVPMAGGSMDDGNSLSMDHGCDRGLERSSCGGSG